MVTCCGCPTSHQAGSQLRWLLRKSAGWAMTFDLILRGGRVIDPSANLDAITDVAFTGGKVARVAPHIQPGHGTAVHDVAGLIVTPGLIDLHTHVYWGGTSLGIDAEDFCRTSGVTT